MRNKKQRKEDMEYLDGLFWQVPDPLLQLVTKELSHPPQFTENPVTFGNFKEAAHFARTG
jgi:hypothetical protein